jgi:broad specificity phosphatase PhoE
MRQAPAEIVMMRHGQAENNVPPAPDKVEKWGGGDWILESNHSARLTPSGKIAADMRRVSFEKEFDPLGFDVFFISTYARTKETLDTMLPANLFPKNHPRQRPRMDSRIDEWNRGIWGKFPEKYIIDSYPDQVKLKAREGFYHYIPPQGESGSQITDRTRSFIDMLCVQYPGARVGIFGHGDHMKFFWKVMGHHTVEELDKLRHPEGKIDPTVVANLSVLQYKGLAPCGTKMQIVKKFEL